MRRRVEAQIQRVVCEVLNLWGKPGLEWFAVPNGGHRNLVEAVNLKRMGVKPGVPDLFLFYKGKPFGLELKAPNGRLSKYQDAYLGALCNAGVTVCVAYSVDQATRALKEWGLIR